MPEIHGAVIEDRQKEKPPKGLKGEYCRLDFEKWLRKIINNAVFFFW